MAIIGFQCLPMAHNAFQCFPMTPNGSQWLPIDPNGFQWLSIFHNVSKQEREAVGAVIRKYHLAGLEY